jgi:hypothetical protein
VDERQALAPANDGDQLYRGGATAPRHLPVSTERGDRRKARRLTDSTPRQHILRPPRQRLDELDAIAYRDGRPLRKWIHAALVAASAKYRATLDRQAGARPSPDIEPAPCQSLPENVLPFFTGHFRQA